MHHHIALCCLFLLAGCRGEDHLSGVAAAFSSDGALHLAARLRSGSQEGGGWGHIAFLYAREDPGGTVTRFEPVVPDARSSYSGYCDDLIQLLVEGTAAQYLFLETGSGVSLWVDPGGGWRSLQLAPGVPAEAQALSGSAQQLRAAWCEQDAVQVLADRWLYRIEGTQIVDAVAVGGSCGRLCYVSHAAGGPVAEAAIIGPPGDAKSSELTCDAVARQCAWAETGGTLGPGDLGGSSCRGGRFFFHAAAAGVTTPIFVRPVRPQSGATYRVLASSPGNELEIVSQNAYFLGAAPLPAGGYAVAVEDYDEQLRLVLVAPDLASRRVIELGGHPWGFMGNSVTVLGSVGGRVHLLYGFGVTVVRHLTIEPAGGDVVSDEEIDLR